MRTLSCTKTLYTEKPWQTNCLTEIAFDEALKAARALDEYYKANGKLFGPLHGIPITLKDQFNIKGKDSTLGYVGRAFSPAVDDAVVVSILRSLGAVILAKTNLPQSIMAGLIFVVIEKWSKCDQSVTD